MPPRLWWGWDSNPGLPGHQCCTTEFALSEEKTQSHTHTYTQAKQLTSNLKSRGLSDRPECPSQRKHMGGRTPGVFLKVILKGRRPTLALVDTLP